MRNVTNNQAAKSDPWATAQPDAMTTAERQTAYRQRQRVA